MEATGISFTQSFKSSINMYSLCLGLIILSVTSSTGGQPTTRHETEGQCYPDPKLNNILDILKRLETSEHTIISLLQSQAITPYRPENEASPDTTLSTILDILQKLDTPVGTSNVSLTGNLLQRCT